MKNFIVLVSLSIGLVGCNQSTKEKNVDTIAKNGAISNSIQLNESYTLMKNNCYACHNPDSKSHDDIIAPPLIAVKMRYKMRYSNKEGFVNGMVNWIQSPDPEKALMRGAISKFKVMPKLPVDTKSLREIVSYIYENELEQPEWFDEHFKEMHGRGMNN